MKRYPLPEKLRAKFNQFAVAVPETEIGLLMQEVEKSVLRFHAFSDEFLAPNVKIADEVAGRCRFLLERYAQSNSRERALIVGAVKYFSTFLDSVPDGKPIVGLDDDIAVTNFVLEELRIKNRFLSVE